MSGFYLSTKYSCQICIILATGCQNLGRLNRRLSEVLVYCFSFCIYKRMFFVVFGSWLFHQCALVL